MAINTKYFVRQHCPFCHQDASIAVPFMNSTPPAEDLGLGDNEVLYPGYTSARSFFTYFRCPSCRGLFCRTYFTEDQLQQLYAHQETNMLAVPEASRERTQQEYFRILKKHSDLTGQLLELGPDVGFFTRCCVKQGQFGKLWLYEPNVNVHEALQQNLGQHEFFLTQQPYSAAGMPSESLSTAVLIHVLDHILTLESLLDELRVSLKPGGILFIVTHDEASLLARMLGRRWPPFAMCHPQLFSAVSIRELLGRHGFEVIEVVKCANYFPLWYLVKSLLTIMGLVSSSQTAFSKPDIRLNLGNIATVARRL
jgi:hypothetical protein